MSYKKGGHDDGLLFFFLVLVFLFCNPTGFGCSNKAGRDCCEQAVPYYHRHDDCCEIDDCDC